MDICEENACSKVNGIGHPYFTRQKRLCMGFCTFLYFLAFVLTCVAISGASLTHNTETFSNTAWTVELPTDAFKHGGNGANVKNEVIGFFGLREVYFPAHNATTSTSNSSASIELSVRSDAETETNRREARRLAQTNGAPDTYLSYASCSSLTSSGDDDVYYNFHISACNKCFTAGHKVIHAVGISIFFLIVLFFLQAVRIWMDRVVIKVTLLVFAWMTFISLACAMGIWKQQCQKNLTAYNSSYFFWSGPGYNCAAAAFAFNFLAFFVNLFTSSRDADNGGGRGFQNFPDDGPGSEVAPAAAQENQAFKPNQQAEVYKGVMIEDEV